MKKTDQHVFFMSSLTLICTTLLVLTINIEHVNAQTAFVAGSCNTINQNISIGKNSTLVVQNDCIADKPEHSYRIRYIWLDSKNTSFVFAGVYNDALKQLLGSSPRLLRYGAYDQVSEILQRFGERITGTDTFFGSNFSNTLFGTGAKSSVSEGQEFASLPASMLKKLRVYSGEEKIIWPDFDSTRTISDTTRWPPKYKLTYQDSDGAKLSLMNFSGKEAKKAHNTVFLCTLLYKALSRNEFDKYWDSVTALGDKIDKGTYGSLMYVNAVFASKEFKSAALEHPSIEAMKYFGSHNWPDDFIYSFGNFTESGCGSGQFGFYALPRSLFVHFAVIESTARLLEISHVSLEKDSSLELRPTANFDGVQQVPLNNISLKRGETMLIPLGIELRYDKKDSPISSLSENSVARDLFQAITNAPVPAFTFYDAFGETVKASKLIRKSKTEFTAPSFQNITPKYIFGNVFSLKSININGTDYPVRKSPADAKLVMSGYFEEGSCPFLFFRMADGQLARYGRVLVGADNASGGREESVPIPDGATSLVIEEREPEISYIDRVSLVERNTGHKLTLTENVALHPRRQIEMDIPESYRRSGIFSVKGHYSVLNPLEAVNGR